MGAISSDAGQQGSSNAQALSFEALEHADAAGYHRQDRDQQGPTVAARESSSDAEPKPKGFRAKLHQVTCAPSGTAQKIMCALFWIAVIVASGVMFAIIFPRFIEHVVTPFIALLRRKLTPMQIAAVIFAAIVILPFSLVMSGMPFVWLAGIVFDYWLALLIVMAASAVGMSLQYWLARYIFHERIKRFLQHSPAASCALLHMYIFHERIERFLQRSPKRHGLAVTLRAVDMAGPWKVVALLRLGPFPYHWLNYALGLCPSIKYPVYIICSVVTELLPRGLQVFFGRSMETLADLLRGRVRNPGVAVYNVVVLLLGIVLVVLSVVYSKRLLRKLEAEELAKEQAEAAAAAAAAADDVEAAHESGSSGSLMSRMSSAASFRRLLSGRQQPSAPAASNANNLL
ncbi:hypothetical protein OEZ86_004579 [Tetradesmus obliquus]|nr:hypothetical protein OEZ86_004579 [Tetradesmus obliquus]